MNIIQGDLLDLARQGEFDVIVHGCNCFNTMGSGIAAQIRKQYPQAYHADNETKSGDINKLGTYSVVTIDRDQRQFDIINAYTQYDFNRHGSRDDLFEYTAFRLILEKLARLNRRQPRRHGLPMIGMGLAGGDSVRIMASLEWFDQQVTEHKGTVTLVEYNGGIQR